MGAPAIEELLEIEGENARKRLAALLPDLSNIHRVVLEGDAALEIVEYARVEKAGLIVMPTHGYGPFRRFILGSVTTKVLHDTQCPVLTGIHVEGASAPQDFGVSLMVCAVDLGPDSERVFQWANQFAGVAGARLVAINVPRPGASGEAQSQLDRLRRETGSEAEPLVEAGEDVSRTVCAAAKRLQADLTVIGRGGFGKSSGRLLAHSYPIIRQSHCPVISV